MLTGSLLRKILAHRTVAGTISLAGSVAGIFKTVASKAGTLSFSGAYSYIKTAHSSVTKAGALALTGALTYTVSLFQQLYTASGVLSLTGAIYRKINALRTKSGTLTLSGAISYLTGNRFTGEGSLTLSGIVTGVRSVIQVSYTASGALGLTGNAFDLQRLSGALGLAGALTYVANPIISRYHFGVDNVGASYIGDPSTDGSWRHIQSGDNLNVEKREAGLWVKKGAFLPS